MRALRDQCGYTLAELLTAMAVTGLLLAGLFLTLQGGQNAYQSGSARAEVQQTARVALDRMLRELRAATQFTTSTGNAVTFKFVDDTNTEVTVAYSLSGMNLQRNQTGAPSQPETLIGNVQALVFTYYDVSGVTTTTPANVRSVDIKLTTRPEAAGLSPANVWTAVMAGRVRVRNE